MDSDDIMHPNRLSVQTDYMLANPKCDVLGTACYSINETNEITGVRFGATEDFSFEDLFFTNYFIHPTVLGKSSWFEDNLYSNSRAQDYELWIRTFRHSSFFNIRQPLLFYREIASDYRVKAKISNQDVREVLSNYIGQGYVRAFHAYALTYAKDVLYSLSGIPAIGSFLIRRRNQILSSEDLEYAQRCLLHATKENDCIE
jgi:hypothetical protein